MFLLYGLHDGLLVETLKPLDSPLQSKERDASTSVCPKEEDQKNYLREDSSFCVFLLKRLPCLYHTPGQKLFLSGPFT